MKKPTCPIEEQFKLARKVTSTKTVYVVESKNSKRARKTWHGFCFNLHNLLNWAESGPLGFEFTNDDGSVSRIVGISSPA